MQILTFLSLYALVPSVVWCANFNNDLDNPFDWIFGPRSPEDIWRFERLSEDAAPTRPIQTTNNNEAKIEELEINEKGPCLQGTNNYLDLTVESSDYDFISDESPASPKPSLRGAIKNGGAQPSQCVTDPEQSSEASLSEEYSISEKTTKRSLKKVTNNGSTVEMPSHGNQSPRQEELVKKVVKGNIKISKPNGHSSFNEKTGLKSIKRTNSQSQTCSSGPNQIQGLQPSQIQNNVEYHTRNRQPNTRPYIPPTSFTSSQQQRNNDKISTIPGSYTLIPKPLENISSNNGLQTIARNRQITTREMKLQAPSLSSQTCKLFKWAMHNILRQRIVEPIGYFTNSTVSSPTN